MCGGRLDELGGRIAVLRDLCKTASCTSVSASGGRSAAADFDVDISQGGRKRSRDGSLRSVQSANGKLPVGRKWEAVLWRQFYRLPVFFALPLTAVRLPYAALPSDLKLEASSLKLEASSLKLSKKGNEFRMRFSTMVSFLGHCLQKSSFCHHSETHSRLIFATMVSRLKCCIGKKVDPGGFESG